MLIKYRLGDVAKDLGRPNKELISLLGEYFPESPKKHQTVLTEEELNVVFEY